MNKAFSEEKYNKENLSSLLILAIGDSTIKDFAAKCNLSVPYLSQLVNKKRAMPPKISTLESIANFSNNNHVTLERLMDACGYDSVRFSRHYNDYTNPFEIFDYILNHTVTDLPMPPRTPYTNFKEIPNFAFWNSGMSETFYDGHIFDQAYLINADDLSIWGFQYTKLITEDLLFNHIDHYYGRLVRMDIPENFKISFVTYEEDCFNAILKMDPLQLPFYVSIILVSIEYNNRRIIKEKYLKTKNMPSAQFKRKYALSQKAVGDADLLRILQPK